MTFALDLWQTITLIAMVLGAFIGLLKLLMNQQVKHIDERMDAQAAATKAAFDAQNVRLDGIERANRDEASNWRRMETEFLSFKADLPLAYVRRDDFIRNQSVLEAKFDGLAHQIQNILLRARVAQFPGGEQ
ncbi:hypothetical protein [Hydrogenophaga taeniospiralis]|uniref:hypothetical protein n=1 Tax=Hydrogenophaga taeniospiralis TaxID=65656 RepID=UPI001CF94404|nr:hypothetical protein [Hydrogenophaga taeniospiralis]UCU94000.1 hypothetical protein KI616_25235 [Hydrogenophaga taeniospiralis]